VMCCYKLVTVEFKWWGLQNKVEKFIHRVSAHLLTTLMVRVEHLAMCVCVCTVQAVTFEQKDLLPR